MQENQEKSYKQKVFHYKLGKKYCFIKILRKFIAIKVKLFYKTINLIRKKWNKNFIKNLIKNYKKPTCFKITKTEEK